MYHVTVKRIRMYYYVNKDITIKTNALLTDRISWHGIHIYENAWWCTIYNIHTFQVVSNVKTYQLWGENTTPHYGGEGHYISVNRLWGLVGIGGAQKHKVLQYIFLSQYI